MTQLFYTTGQAAKLLGITTHAVRRLAAAGLLKAEPTSGGHLRIPIPEAERLKREGIPLIPQIVQSGAYQTREHDHPRSARDMSAGYAQPVDSDLVRESFDEITIAENALRRRKIDLDSLSLEDQFREHDDWSRSREIDRGVAEAKERAAAEAARVRQQWEHRWHQYALRRFPDDAPATTKLELPGRVSAVLKTMEPNVPEYVTRNLLGAVIAECTEPWRKQQQLEKAIQSAVDKLPRAAKGLELTTWQTRAIARARAAIEKLGGLATLREIEAVACEATEPIIREFEYREICDRIVRMSHVNGAMADELKEGRELVQRAFLALPIGTSIRQLEMARDEALRPLFDRIANRMDQEVRQAVVCSIIFPWDFPPNQKGAVVQAIHKKLEEVPTGTPRRVLEELRQHVLQPFLNSHSRHKKKKQLIESSLGEIFPYLLKLKSERRYDGGEFTTERNLRPVISKVLERELTGDESPDGIAKRIKVLVRHLLGTPGSRR